MIVMKIMIVIVVVVRGVYNFNKIIQMTIYQNKKTSIVFSKKLIRNKIKNYNNSILDNHLQIRNLNKNPSNNLKTKKPPYKN